MAAQALISPEEYLRTSYEGLDRDHVRGEVVERSKPVYIHAEIQALICILFGDLLRRRLVFFATELRLA